MTDLQRTLVLLKPDAVRRGLAGTILARYEATGLAVVAMEFRQVDAAMADRHYAGLPPVAFDVQDADTANPGRVVATS